MAPKFGSDRYVVQRQSGPQTCASAGDYAVDNYDQSYRIADAAEARSIRNSTGGSVHTLWPNGSIS